MIFGKKIMNYQYMVKRTKIERHHEVVLLEITFGEECNFKKHIDNICLQNITYHVKYKFYSESTLYNLSE